MRAFACLVRPGRFAACCERLKALFGLAVFFELTAFSGWRHFTSWRLFTG